MKIFFLIFVLSLFCPAPAQADEFPIMGELGHPLGTYLIIEGMGIRAEKGKKVPAGTLLVDIVNGKKLESPVSISIEIENVDVLPKDTRCILRGYESGKMIGVPNEVAEKEQIPAPAAVWQFFHYFIVTSIVEPKDLKYRFIFKEYFNLVNPHAQEKNLTKIEDLSQYFVNKHKDINIAEIYIWNTDLNTKNNLLFQKTYQKANTTLGVIAYPKYKYANPRAINIHELEAEGQKYILIEQQLDAISYRMVIFVND
ncbi:MAG: hypothetical protein M0Z79_07450 [Nitrospiraceae bacterium]|nr:hypothetical protein [Nitrospiraceae bacterium]